MRLEYVKKGEKRHEDLCIPHSGRNFYFHLTAQDFVSSTGGAEPRQTQLGALE